MQAIKEDVKLKQNRKVMNKGISKVHILKQLFDVLQPSVPGKSSSGTIG